MEDMHQLVVNVITERICSCSPDCEPYHQIIFDTIDNFMDDDLPKLNKHCVDDFIDDDFRTALASRAANVLVDEVRHCHDEAYFTCCDYLDNKRKLSFMAKIIANDEGAIHEAMREIDEKLPDNEKIFEAATQKTIHAQTSPNKDILDYADKYGDAALGFAIRDMVENGDFYFNPSTAEDVWEYGGRTE